MAENDASGKREIIRWQDEDRDGSGAYGTYIGDAMIPLKNARITPTDVQEFEEERQAQTSGEITIDYEKGVQDSKFVLAYNPQDWRLYVMAFGYTDNTDETTHRSHSFRYKTDKNLESFTVQRVKNLATDIVETYNGCKINVHNISWNAAGGGIGKYIECTAECLAKEVVDTETEGTEETSPNILAKLQSRQVVLTINGTAITRCLSGNIRHSNKLGPDDGFFADASATTTRSETDPEERKVSGTFRIRYAAKTYFDLWKAGVEVGTSLDTGTVTSATTTTIDDTGQGWTPDAYIGKILKLTGGVGRGQYRLIIDNDADTLTVSQPFFTTPTTTTTFSILEPCSVEIRRTATTDTGKFFLPGFRLRSAPVTTNMEGFNMMVLDWVAVDVIPEITDARTDYYATA